MFNLLFLFDLSWVQDFGCCLPYMCLVVRIIALRRAGFVCLLSVCRLCVGMRDNFAFVSVFGLGALGRSVLRTPPNSFGFLLDILRALGPAVLFSGIWDFLLHLLVGKLVSFLVYGS